MNMRFQFLILCLLLSPISLRGGDGWPQFRGPHGNGIAAEQTIPVEIGESTNLAWRTELAGRGWSSPIIADDVIYLTTAVERTPNQAERLAMLRDEGIEERKFKQLAIAKSIALKLIAIDFNTGSLLQTIDLSVIPDPDPIHSLNSYSSPTPTIDDETIYCHFGTYGTYAVDRKSGEIAWTRRLPLKHSVGPGSSPFIYKDLLILIQDGIDRQYVTALNKKTGETTWERDRPEIDAADGEQKKAYCTPIAITDQRGREQLICMGSQWMVSYAPATGEEIWRVKHGKGFSVVPCPVYGDEVVYFSTGFTKPALFAVRVDGDGDVSDTHVNWVAKQGIPAKPSPILHEGLIYLMADNGVASCLNADTGEQVWKKRIGGDYSASPILAGGHLYFASQDGKVTVLEPGREGKIVAENQIDGRIMASPAVVKNTLVVRSDQAIYQFK